MRNPTTDEIQTAAIVLGKIATADQWAAKPDAAMALTWAECFTTHNLQRPDLLEAVIRLYSDDTRDKANRTLPADIIGWARKLRRERQEREKAQLNAAPDAKVLSPERKAIAACGLCDDNGWIDIGARVMRCDHTRAVAS